MPKHSVTFLPSLLLLPAFLLCQTSPVLARATPSVAVRGSQNGQAIDARIEAWNLPAAMATPATRLALKQGQRPERIPGWPEKSATVLKTNNGFLPWTGSSQWRYWRVSAPGHATLPVLIPPGNAVHLTTIWLDPLPARTTDGKTGEHPQERCQSGQVCGHVLDAETHQPLANAVVTAQAGTVTRRVHSHANGFFSLDVDQRLGQAAESSGLAIRISAPDHVQQVWQHVNWHAGPQLIADLRRGSGVETHSLKHPLSDVPLGHVPRSWLQAKLSQLPSAQVVSPVTASHNRAPPVPVERPGGAVFMDPPDSIAVGFSATGGYCCGNSCATSQVFSLETYVQKGLDNEWISSWESDSLKAGSVPFRSYGAWHAIESPYNGYDICAGPCCQAFEQTSYASTVSTAVATRGILLELNGALARSEYSAENNAWNDPDDGLSCTNADLSCGDGFVGSPLYGWPCLADDSARRGCFGHGRGMSQWGTHFHAQAGENWAAIIDHYYNALGSPGGDRSQYPTTPVALLSFAAWPQTLNAGTDFSIALSVDNRAGAASGAASFGPILIGASLLASGSDYSDPANDSSVLLNAFGQQNLSRPFQTDPAWPPGLYDLAVALWLDVDNNSVITGDDWVLAFAIQSDAVTLLAPDDLIFADGF